MRVLVVEDHEALGRLTARVLEGAGHQARVETTVAGALDVIERWPPDVVMTDLRLPDGRGEEVARAARAAGARVIAVSGDRPGPEAAAAFDQTLEKPISNPELLAAVREANTNGSDDPHT